MDQDTLLALIAQGEGPQVELKGSGARPGELAQRLSGLANASGGWLIMGVDDATLQPVGVTSVKYAKDNIVQATRLCQPPLLLDPPEPLVVTVDGRRKLVVAYVPATNGALVQAGGVCWVRRGSLTVPMTVEEIAAASTSRGLVRWDTLPAPGNMADLDPELVSQFLAARPQARMRHSSSDQALLGLGAVREAPGRGMAPTNAGLLLFSAAPQQALPQASVTCVEWRSPDEAPATAGRGGWLDQRRLSGPLPDLIEEAVHFVASHTRQSARIVGTRRRETPEYPPEAIREAVVNAVVHRDYSLAEQGVRIFVYHNHVQVRSPGLLMPGVTLDLLQQGVPLSRPRNFTLMSLLRDWPGGAYCEQLGSGVRLMRGAMEELDLPAPVMREEGNEFVVYFFRDPADLPNLSVPGDTAPPKGRPASPVALPGVPDAQASGLNLRQLQGLAFVREHGRITNAEYRAITLASERTAARDLTELMNRGLLLRRGGGNALHYTLPDGDAEN